jgi:phosphoenolpyruvate synthase/pyruvate phosphate dikinase
MVPGQHAQLTHGDTQAVATRFRTDFTTWEWQNEVLGAEEAIKRALEHLYVGSLDAQAELKNKLGAQFSHNYLVGYFEAILWPDHVMRFSDYNRLLESRIPMPSSLETPSTQATSGEIKGTVAHKGKATGKVRVVQPEAIASAIFDEGDILVTDNTDIRFVGLMQKAGAIVTDRGGMLSHASIVARELKKPCIVGTSQASRLLKDGDLVEVDAEQAVVRILKRFS